MNQKLGLFVLVATGLVVMALSMDIVESKDPERRSTFMNSNDEATVEDGRGGIVLYESFEDFQPWLLKNNDTTYIINFWATWCKPCVAELPVFEALNAKVQDDKVKVILCSLDFPNAIESSLYPFVEKHDLQSQVVVLLDGKTNRWIDKVSPEWSGAIPATYIYKKDKKLFLEKSFDDIEELKLLVKEVF